MVESTRRKIVNFVQKKQQMKIRKIKKEIKKTGDKRFIRMAMHSLKLLLKWSKIDHRNSKSNMKILQENFLRNGKFIY